MTQRRIQAPQDFVAGTSLVLLAVLALWASKDLVYGRITPGPGCFPGAGADGAGHRPGAGVARLPPEGEASRWRLRGPFFVSVAVLAFALTIRTPGLAVAGPLVVMVSGGASPETRWRELAIYAVVITVACVLLFRTLLRLPVPILVIPGVFVL
jgi:putative tricarboxylic transport membrane protein